MQSLLKQVDGSARTLLTLFSHPDDEAFGTAGTLAKYAAQGVRVVIVTATLGEEGEIADPALANRDNLGEVRWQELLCSARTIGASAVEHLGLRDGDVDKARPGLLAERIVAILRKYKPDVVITFGPDGIYGHSDHIATGSATLQAVVLAADPGFVSGGGPAVESPHSVGALYYTAVPKSQAQQMQSIVALQPGTGPDFENFGTPDEDITTIMDVQEQLAAKIESVRCHATQAKDGAMVLKQKPEVVREIFGKEYYSRVDTRGNILKSPDGQIETELF